MRLFYRTNVSWERLCFGFPPQKLPRGDPALFQHLKKGEKQEGGKLILNQGASGFKTVLTQTYKNCLLKNGAWIRERRLNIFMRCRFYSTCVKFCSANGDYNSKLILYTPEIKHTALSQRARVARQELPGGRNTSGSSLLSLRLLMVYRFYNKCCLQTQTRITRRNIRKWLFMNELIDGTADGLSMWCIRP